MEEDGAQDFKKKSKRFRLSVKNRKRVNGYFGEYCQHTSIHGFQYLGEPKRSCLEKLWWFVTLTVSFIICGYLILKTYQKWEMSPVIVSFATKQVPIFEIPFPAITLCPAVKSDKNKVNYTALVNSLKRGIALTESGKLHHEYMSLVCDSGENFSKNASGKFDRKILDFFDEVVPPFNETMLSCRWLGKEVPCEELFKPVMTDEGVCYSFNLLDRSEIFDDKIVKFKNYFQATNSNGYNMEKGYDAKESKDSYPRRALYPGAKEGLMVKLRVMEKDIDYKCGNSLHGYKIVLHHSADVPITNQQYFRVPLDHGLLAALTPEMITTKSSLHGYHPNQRQCFFQKERHLAYFKIYTQRNCEIECLTNHTFKYCGCVNFHMPRTKNMSICGPANIQCMQKIQPILLNKEINLFLDEKQHPIDKDLFDDISDMIIHGEKAPKPKRIKRTCNCLPSCSSISYNAETSQSEWYWKKTMETVNGEETTNGEHRSMLLVYFKKTQFIPSERDELYGHIDFLANCGGLLGLFMGFSFMSLVEIIYFLSLRLCCNIRLYGKQFWHGSMKY